MAKVTKIAAVLPVLGLTEGRRQGGGHNKAPHLRRRYLQGRKFQLPWLARRAAVCKFVIKVSVRT